MDVQGLTFTLTCPACPEQYNVYLGDKQVGYVRLRHGKLWATASDHKGETVYEAETKGDGMFDTDEERERHLTAIAAAIRHADQT